MYPIEVIKSPSFQKPRLVRDNFNRDSSFHECRTPGREGFIVHSGAHRSTCFVSKSDHADGWFSATFWLRQGQAAVNGWVEATVGDASLEACEENAALKALGDGWRIHRVKASGKSASAVVTLVHTAGKVETRYSAGTLRHAFAKAVGILPS